MARNMSYSNTEIVDMIRILGECNGNGCAAARRYEEKFPNRQHPDRRTFFAVDRRARETGSLSDDRAGKCGRHRTALVPEVEEEILDIVSERPESSVRKIASQVGVSHFSVWKTLKEQSLVPFHIQTVQALELQDYGSRMEFCNWLLRKNARNVSFVNAILSTDEASFNRNGITNHHNDHIWSEENPNAKRESHFQRNFSVNVWAGIVDNHLIGPVFFPNRLNGAAYLHFLENELPEQLEIVNLHIRQNMWYLQDGAPPHYSLQVRQCLSRRFPGRWIGRGADAPISWPARSPDLNPIDFCFWGVMKDKVYSVPIESVEHLRQRIQQSAEEFRNIPGVFQNVRFSLLKRARYCIQENGNHFEHILK